MVKVLNNRILIKEVIEEVKSASGIIIGTTEKTTQRIGIVISVGNSVEEIEIGDKVLFDSCMSALLELDGETYLIMEENNVIGVYL